MARIGGCDAGRVETCKTSGVTRMMQMQSCNYHVLTFTVRAAMGMTVAA